MNKQMVMYTVMGVSATVFNWMVYAILVAFLPMVFANAFSWTATLLFAFVTNKYYVFESKNWDRSTVLKEMIAFTTARGLTGFLEIVLQPQAYALGLDKTIFGVEGLEAKITVCLGLVVVNYFSTKWIVFREPAKEMESV